MAALYSHTTRSTGTTLTAAIYNADHQNHIDNGIPAQLDDYSSNAAQMQAMTSPGTVGSESLATTLAGELERLRYIVNQMNGGAQWYDLTGMGGYRKNAIIGGDASTNPWQRETVFTSIASGVYHADRFRFLNPTSSAAFHFRKIADAPTFAQAGRVVTHCFELDVATADAAVAAGDIVVWGQKIEGYNFLPLAQRPMTLSFWHKHTKTGTYCVGFQNGGGDRYYVAEYTQAVSDTWEKATITVAASPSAGTWDYTTGLGLVVDFVVMAGSTYNGATAGAWATGALYATTNQVNAADSVSNYMRFALIQLEAGSVATEFEARSVQQELALCQRYYNKTYSQGTAPGTVTSVGALGGTSSGTAATFAVTVPWTFPVAMRSAPTVVFYSAFNAATGTWYRNTAAANVSMVLGVTAGTANVMITNNAAVTDQELVFGQATAAAEL